MSLILFIGSLFGSLLGNMDNTLVADSTYEQNRLQYFRYHSVSDEEYDLKQYIATLMDDYDEEGLTDAQIQVKRNEIYSLIRAKASSLGLTVDGNLDLFEEYDAYNAQVSNEEKIDELQEYKQDLLDKYDFSSMTYSKYLDTLSEINKLVVAKAEELGLSYEDYYYNTNYLRPHSLNSMYGNRWHGAWGRYNYANDEYGWGSFSGPRWSTRWNVNNDDNAWGSVFGRHWNVNWGFNRDDNYGWRVFWDYDDDDDDETSSSLGSIFGSNWYSRWFDDDDTETEDTQTGESI